MSRTDRSLSTIGHCAADHLSARQRSQRQATGYEHDSRMQAVTMRYADLPTVPQVTLLDRASRGGGRLLNIGTLVTTCRNLLVAISRNSLVAKYSKSVLSVATCYC